MAMGTDIGRAVEVLRQGGLVAFPTETVYGLGGDATNLDAVRRIFGVKQRPRTNPLIVHIADEDRARRYAQSWPKNAHRLAQAFWPGPLTIIVPRNEKIVPEVTAGLTGVGLRCPNHPFSLQLLQQFDGAVAGPSANRWTRLSPTTAAHVAEDLADNVDYILDGGPCPVGIESTVISVEKDKPIIYRPGRVSPHEIEKIIGSVQIFSGVVETDEAANSPGLSSQHYAPSAPTWRVEHWQLARISDWCRQHPQQPAAVLLLRPQLELTPPHRVIVMGDDPAYYARQLYVVLHEAEKWAADIWIEMPPDESGWFAVRDRLTRAARPG